MSDRQQASWKPLLALAAASAMAAAGLTTVLLLMQRKAPSPPKPKQQKQQQHQHERQPQQPKQQEKNRVGLPKKEASRLELTPGAEAAAVKIQARARGALSRRDTFNNKPNRIMAARRCCIKGQSFREVQAEAQELIAAVRTVTLFTSFVRSSVPASVVYTYSRTRQW